MSLKTVSILGCGWMGFPLAVTLIRRGHPVKGSTTTVEKFPVLRQAGIAPFLLKCAPRMSGEGIEEFYRTDILIITIPFKRAFKDPREYKTQIDSIIAYAEKSSVQNLIFTSSTSVYPKTLTSASENVVFEPDNPRSKVLREIENSLRANDRFKTTIVRFAGLCGQDRQPGRFLAGKENLPDPQEPVNLIHLDDCVEILAKLIDNEVWGEVFNACADEHPSRRELYVQAAKRMGLPPPAFSAEGRGPYRIVDNTKIKKRLDYCFQHPDPRRFP